MVVGNLAGWIDSPVGRSLAALAIAGWFENYGDCHEYFKPNEFERVLIMALAGDAVCPSKALLWPGAGATGIARRETGILPLAG